MKRFRARPISKVLKFKHDSRSAGFTLVEVIVTLLAAVVMITAVSVAVNAHSVLAQRHRDTVIANAYANSKIEALRSLGFLGLTNGTTNITSELPEELKAPRSASLVVSSFSTSIKEIELTINYNERGVTRTYTYTTLIGELGVGQY